MSKHVSETPATAFLKKSKVAFAEHPYDYEERGGTRVSSEKLASRPKLISRSRNQRKGSKP